jgi:DNA-binding transcriptional LysR family regulator
MFDWDDLKVFLAAARAGSFGAASQRLGVDTATVGRRVGRLETSLKATLFIRSPSGLQLTATGTRLLESAADAELNMLAAARVTEPEVVAGAVRISAAEGFGTAILARALPALAERRPGLRIELAAHAGFLSPSRREVDMAVTLSPSEGQRLVVEPLASYQLALYAAPEYLARHGPVESLDDLRRGRLVGYVDDLLYAGELRYLEEISPGLTPTLASSSIQAQRAMITQGGGVGVLPAFLADRLVRVLPDVVQLERRFWLATHREVHATARVRVVRAWLGEVVAQHAQKLRPF